MKSLNLFHDVLNGKSIFLNIDNILFYLSSTEVDSVSYFDFLFAFYNVYAFFCQPNGQCLILHAFVLDVFRI